MTNASFPVISVRGGPYERGEQYGRLASDRIRASLELYASAWRDTAAPSERSAIRRRARGFLSMIGERFPAMAEELHGIAAGAGCEVEEIVALNARTEILFGSSAGDEDGCTSAALMPEVTDGRVVVGQNWDWRARCRETTVVLRAIPDDGPAFMTVVEAGMLARSGFNDQGLAVCGNFLACAADGTRDGIPIPVVRRAILQSRSLPEAVGHVLRLPRAFSSNHLIAHRDGEAVDLEVTPEEAFTLFPEEGLLAHANHFVAGAGFVNDTGRARFPDTLFRDRRLRRHLARRAPPLGIADLEEGLKDHFGHPGGICRHMAEGEDDPAAVVTILSVVMDLGSSRMFVAPGPPCATDYTALDLLAPDLVPEVLASGG